MGGGAQFGREGEVRESEERNETFPRPWHEESIAKLPLEGKVAIITGGTSEIGACTAEVFVANSARFNEFFEAIAAEADRAMLNALAGRNVADCLDEVLSLGN